MEINEGGCFYSPTIILGIQNDMRVGREEIFGPVLSVMTFENEQKAISLANDSDYGLSLSVWSKNIDKAMGMIRKVNGGRTWVNTTIAGGPGQPLGGYKQSGIGRDAGLYGVEEYTEIKSIHVALGKRMSWIK